MDGGRSTVAGVLDIVSGVCGLMGSLLLIGLGVLGSGLIASVVEDPAAPAWLPSAVLVPLALLPLAFSILAVAGGMAAIRRSSWLMAVLGAVAAMVCLLPLGIAALVVTLLAEPEFRNDRERTVTPS